MIKISKDKLLDLVKKYKYTIALFTIIFIFSLIFRTKTNSLSFLKDIFFSLLGTSLIYVLLDLFIALRLRWVGVAFLSVLITADLSLFYLYRTPMNYGIIASIFETNLDEVVSMSQGGLWVLVLFLLVSSIFLLTMSTKEMKVTKRIPILFSIAYLFIFIFVVSVIAEIKVYRQPLKETYEKMKVAPHVFFVTQLPNKYPFIIGDLAFFIAYIEEMRAFDKYAHKEKKLPLGVIYDEKIAKPSKFVLIVGESAQRKHMSVYGYKVATTPFLDSLKINSDELIVFDSVISPASITREAIRLSLSYATTFEKEAFWENMNVIDLANNSGYKTTWIANQTRFGIHDSYTGRISASAHNILYNNDMYKENYRPEDLSLLPVFRQNLGRDKDQFITLHLNGSHLDYSNKYDEIDTEALGSEGETIEYDKSIHHTDRVIAQLYYTLKAQGDPFTLLYYSDHAEVVNLGHGTANRHKAQFTIPLVIISNTLEREGYFGIVSKYYNESTKRLSSVNLIYFLSEIIGYSVNKELVERAKQNTEYIYQVDGSIKRYSEIKD